MLLSCCLYDLFSISSKLLFFLILASITHTVIKLVCNMYTNMTYTSYLEKHGLPVEGKSWLFGNMVEKSKNIRRTLDFDCEGFARGDTYAQRPPVFSTIVMFRTRDPRVIECMLRERFDDWNKPDGGFFRLMQGFVGNGIFTAKHGPHSADKGHTWLITRKIASGIFTRNMFRDLMRTTFVQHTHAMIRIINTAIDEKSSSNGVESKHKSKVGMKDGKALDMQKLFFGFTMDSIMKIFFGKETYTMGDEVNEYTNAFDEAQRSLMEYAFKRAVFILALPQILPFPFGPLWRGAEGIFEPHILRKLDSNGRKFDRLTEFLNRRTLEIIDEKLLDPNLPSQKDLLALFMNSEDDQGVSFSAPKYRSFLRDVCLNFVLAGRDTTACTLAWTFFILATHPEIQNNLISEIDLVLGEKRRGGEGEDEWVWEEPTYNHVTPSAMPYLNGVVYESLRLYPPVPSDFKEACCDTTLPDGLHIPKGSRLTFMPYATGRDEKRYPDPLAVKPERWIPFTAPNTFEFPAFQAGPRICLGMNMALLEAKIVIVMLLQRFRFSLLQGELEKIRYSLSITMCVCNSPNGETHELWLVPERRQ